MLPTPGTVKPQKTGNVEKAAKEARQANTEFIYFIYQNLQINAENLDLFERIKIHITDYLHSKLKASPPFSTVQKQKFLLEYIRNPKFNNIINAVLESVAKINVPEFDKSIAEGIANMILLNNIEKANEDKEKILAFVDEWTKEKQRKRDEKVRVQRLQEEARRQEELEIAERRQKEELAKATFRQKLEARDFELREAEAHRNMPTTENITRTIQKNIAASFVKAKRTANAAANAAAKSAAAAKREYNAAASVTMAGTAAALRTLVNELVHLSTTYLPKKSFFSRSVETATYAEIVPQLHVILSTTITDPIRGPDYKANMNSECFKEYLIHTLKKLHEFLIKFKAEISLLEKEVARGQTVKIPVLAEKKEDLQRRIEETAASIAQAITDGVTNTVWRENIEFIEGLPIRFKREDAKTYPKCEAEINKNKQLLTESGKSILAGKNMGKEANIGRDILAKKVAGNSANIAATPLSYLPTTFPFRNTKKKALYRRLIPKLSASLENMLTSKPYNKDAIKREINAQCFKDFLIEYLRTIKNDVLSPEEEAGVIKELAKYLFEGCPTKVPTTPFQNAAASAAMLQGSQRKEVEDDEEYNAEILAKLRRPVEPRVPIGSSSPPRGTLPEEGNSTSYTGGGISGSHGGRRSHKKSASKGRDATRRGRRARTILRGPRATVSKKNGRRSARRTRRRSSS